VKLHNVLTIDVEDYFQVSGFEEHAPRREWDDFECRVEANTYRLLELLADCDVTATFFVLGWVADRYPNLVRDIHAQGHEIASHSYWHRLIYSIAPDEFRRDLRQSREVLEDAIGEPVTAFRAPSFSITERSRWAQEILAEEGFTVDSSVFPIHHDRYGIPDAQPRLHQIETAAGDLWEFPPSVARFARTNIPVSGGGYFRLFPYRWTSHWLRQINTAGQPFIFYLHPWEIDPEQPRIHAASRLSKFRHYVNLKTTEKKLSRLLSDFRFTTLRDVISAMDAPQSEEVETSELCPV